MPTLDDLPTLAKNAAVAANDSIAISNENLGGGTKIQQVPAALVGLGFTHAFVVNWNNASLLAHTGDGTDQIVSLLDISANSIATKAMYVVTEAFAGLGACNFVLGRTADPNGYFESTSILAKTAAVNQAGDEIDAFGEVDVITASDQSVIITFDPAGDALDELTAGQIVILIALSEIADFKDLVPAT